MHKYDWQGFVQELIEDLEERREMCTRIAKESELCGDKAVALVYKSFAAECNTTLLDISRLAECYNIPQT